MDYWAETMQDGCYLIAVDGWKAETSRVIETDKKGKEKDTWTGTVGTYREASTGSFNAAG
jgi:hypothetical protein